MTYIKTIKLNINTAGEQLTPNVEDNHVEIEDWAARYNWALNKILDNSCEIIDKNKIESKINYSMDDLYQTIYNVEEYIAKSLKTQIAHLFERRKSVGSSTVIYDEDTVIFPSSNEGQVFVIAEHKGTVDSVINSFEGRISNFSTVAEDFGLDIELKSGRSFAEEMSENLNAEVIDRGDFDNTTEESVYSEITDRLTESIDSNVTLRFGEDDPETFEYDLILHAGSDNRIVIEIKDASRPEADLAKEDLIDTPRDKTNIIKSNREQVGGHKFPSFDNTEAFVIVKHMSDGDFGEQKQKAERRDIHLLKYEDGDYISELEEQFKPMVIAESN